MGVTQLFATVPLNPIVSQERLGPERWRFSTRGVAVRLFLTCWLIFTLHFATNTVREIYLALAIGDHLSFRVDEYANMHPDLFETPGRGWHIGNNPGASMVAAIPYAMARPVIDPVVAAVNGSRAAGGQASPPSYGSEWPMAREFYAEAWRRGYDVKFGLGAFVMQAFAMAPLSALGATGLFYLLRQLFMSDKVALWLALLYSFGTPVLFRTGFLNQNMMLGHIAFLGFLALWNPGNLIKRGWLFRMFLGGLAGGTALLFDYSGIVLLGGLFLYGLAKFASSEAAHPSLPKLGLFYALGAAGPVGLLWFYQWASFGNPFLPGQHWMPAVEWIDLGYQGYGLPQGELLLSLAFDYRYGLFLSSPLLLIGLACPLLDRGPDRSLPRLELWTILAIFAAFWVFFSGSNYTRLQFNTGIRYMTPVIPFLFIPTAVVLMRLPKLPVYLLAVLSVAEAWPLAMYRDVERGLGLLDPVLHVFLGGFQLPSLNTLSRMGSTYGDYAAQGPSPIPIFVLTAALVYAIWMAQPGRAVLNRFSGRAESSPPDENGACRESPAG